MTNFESVKKFMHTFGQEVRTKAGFPNDKIIGLRLDLIREELSELKEAVENIKKNSRRFAKRQITWFKRDKDIVWFEPDQVKAIQNFIV